MLRLLSHQRDDGSWEGEFVMNTTPLSQYVIVHQLTGRPVSSARSGAMIRHFRASVTAEGGWRLYPDPDASPSPYCTTLAYIALRLLGLPVDDPLTAGARAWLHEQPGRVAAVPTWGKFWLAVCGLYDYRAVNAVPPEFFLLPRWFPVHPDRLYCYARLIFQAMACLYGTRFRGDLGPLSDDLRRELFGGHKPRRSDRTLLGADASLPPSAVLRLGQSVLSWYERRPVRALRERALERCLRRVEHEQQVTDELGLSSITGALNVLALHASGAGPHAVEQALEGLEHWRWEDQDGGTRYLGNRSATWDTSFAVEALLAYPTSAAHDAVRRACGYLQDAQVTREIESPGINARIPALGGWCFTDGAHRWPVSDCTGEALAALFHARRAPCTDRLGQAADFMLRTQNKDGGFGTYEPRRGSRLLERLNPSELFSHCMIEDSYAECTASVLTALAPLMADTPEPRRTRLRQAVSHGARYLLRQQHRDGSWPAAWGINRVYGTFFAVRGLLATGCPPTHPRLQRAAAWLESVQRPDGGWGEHFQGFLERRYVPHRQSQPTVTALALLALMEINGPDHPAVRDGICWLRTHQNPDGSWDQTAATGACLGTGVLDYLLYSEYFPLWALGRWLTLTNC
ncbi:prenyltransferase/squalene oxidase repeat-containing protein [Streptomyces sp. YIM 121038]|uniref:prenyltransferase/squalene oxidase repeat-containing protein n=1 Tax=Streptomyces sp. YIM 121038 TaxID=2136401 RepID=UPI0022A901D2|nr:prenyltransferase/squalene oxidase repeat-containing protein [Streptomyces sp. YIM 121038]